MAKKFIDKNTQFALQAYEDQIRSCEDQIDILSSLSNRVCSISQESDPVQLLQVMLVFRLTAATCHRHLHLIMVTVALSTVFTQGVNTQRTALLASRLSCPYTSCQKICIVRKIMYILDE